MTNRTVLVTGSARRLGREIALSLAQAGWQVAVHYRGSVEEAHAAVAECARLAPKLKFEAFQADLGDEAATRVLVPRVVAAFGSLDAVVNNASLFEHDTASSFRYDTLQSHLLTNTGAPIVLSQALHEHVRSRGGTGAVVNLLDQKLWNPNPDFLSYTLSKAALEAANTSLALALAPELRVVGVAPGLTLTSHMLSQEKFEQLHKLSPLGRSSTPQDVVHAVRFALENGSITGTTLLVDGGQHLQRFDRDFSLM
ncbi:SDR family oxidoreductase [Ramlibacter albus]|uniref:SDR family oxidoreductase n=1 Tax=Ramlibacter albus TaxID=2079448 RepID=A0A923M6S7_9BURK|nr:SDR family oxidoreductase [Ramlibacter albus]MBC5764883.1 SDR family oxidoreductase [Ramlibacter albus]